MGTYSVRCQLLCTWTHLCLPCYCTSAHDRLTMRYLNSCSGYPVALDGSGLVLVFLLFGCPVALDGSGLVPVPLVLGKG